MNHDIPLRITVLDPLPGVTYAMQRGRDELLPPATADAQALTFELSVRVSAHQAGGAPNVLGPYAQGKPDDRFLYVNSGTLAGQQGTDWTRRAKIKTAGISWPLVEQVVATPGAVLEARIAGRAKDGGPCCATVPLLDGRWTVGMTEEAT